MINLARGAFGRRYMDIALRSGRDYRVRILERPALWMSDAQIADLSAQLGQVATATLPNGALHYGVFAGDRAAFCDVVITLVTRRDGTPVAFNALALMQVQTLPRPVDVVHLGLVMVDPAERSKNLSWILYGLTCFFLFARRQFRPIWVSNVTQVPAVVGMVSAMFSHVWPQPGGARRSLQHLLLARRIMAAHRGVFGVGPKAGFDEDNFVITAAYTGGSDDLRKDYDTAPKHRDAQYNDFCAAQLDYDRGDDFLQLGQMDMAAMRTYLARQVPRSELFGLLAAVAIVALQRVALPLIHWADSGRDWSILRARSK